MCATLSFGAVLGLTAACFDPPAEDVLFSCNASHPTPCPPDYTCEKDGCCHREGSDVEAMLGACSLAAASETGTQDDTGESSDTTDSGTN